MKKSDEEYKNIPHQKIGEKLDTENKVEASSANEAQTIFAMAVARLLDVNCWDKVSGALSSTFHLTDQEGNETKGPLQKGYHFKIDIPGPGPSAGDGYDWVRVEAIDDERNPAGETESVTVRVRPTANPTNRDQDTAHFFKEFATSSFRVERTGNNIIASVHGRNEVPNTDTEKTTDKIRNAVVGLGAAAGLSNPQWNSLVNGLLDSSIEDH